MDSRGKFSYEFLHDTIPQKPSFIQRPCPGDSLKYGAYLMNAGACIECHTPVKKGQIIAELIYSGGREFVMPIGIIRSAKHHTKYGNGYWEMV